MTSLKLIAVVAFLAGITAGYAAERSIRQKGKVISEAEVTIKKGDSLLFVNDDSIAHNVLSTSPPHKFNLGLMQAGNATPLTFKSHGEHSVICAIPPSMTIAVMVLD